MLKALKKLNNHQCNLHLKKYTFFIFINEVALVICCMLLLFHDDIQIATSIVAICVSIGSLIVSRNANNLSAQMLATTIEHDIASVRPYLQMQTEANRDRRELKVSLKNMGLGPATIAESWAWIDDRDYFAPERKKKYHTIHDLFINETENLEIKNKEIFLRDYIHAMTIVEHYTIPANESITVMHIIFPSKMSNQDIERVLNLLSSFVLYCSYVDIYHIYEDSQRTGNAMLEDISDSEVPTVNNIKKTPKGQFVFQRSFQDIKEVSKWLQDL